MRTMILDDVAIHLKAEISDLPYDSRLQMRAVRFIAFNNERYSDAEIRYAILYIFQKSKGV